MTNTNNKLSFQQQSRINKPTPTPKDRTADAVCCMIFTVAIVGCFSLFGAAVLIILSYVEGGF